MIRKTLLPYFAAVLRKIGCKEIKSFIRLIDYYFYDNVYNCLKAINNTESCQILANLCVITLYDETNPVCIIYNLINLWTPRPSRSKRLRTPKPPLRRVPPKGNTKSALT